MEKRRDNKGRVLKTGESQRKDGRYSYSYFDEIGRRKFIYSWQLDYRDAVPQGKKAGKSLREMEEEIENCKRIGIAPYGAGFSVLNLVRRYVSMRTSVKHTTKKGYQTVINWLEKDPFGNQRIDTIRTSDAKLWFIKLQQKDGKSYTSIHTIRGVLRPAFQMAVDDDLLVKNPFEFQLHTVLVNDSVTRDALSRADERRFLKFIKEDDHYNIYFDPFFILFNTGLRISEFVGLTMKDVDLKEKTINVNHQLFRDGKYGYYTESPKTEKGNRVVPMSDEVAAAFERIIKSRPKPKKEFIINGYGGFIFIDKKGNPRPAYFWEKKFQLSVEKHNSIYQLQLPKISPHICRHTFCSKMAKKGMNPKILQYIMGHADISVTMNTYTHVKADEAKVEMERLREVVNE